MVSNVVSALLSSASAMAGPAANFIATDVSNRKQYRYQQKLMAKQAALNYKYSLKSAENMPSSTRAGLENAGYNPMLAVQNATSGANSSWSSGGQMSAQDYSGAISAGIENAQSFQRLKNETRVADTQAELNEATSQNQTSQSINNLEENKWISPKRKAEIANVKGNTALMSAQIENMEKQIELGFAGIDVQQEANAISAIGKEEYADRAKRYKEFGERHPYLRNIDETLTRYFNGFGFNGSKKIK